MSNEPNKPIEAEELKEKELECVTGGRGGFKLPEQIELDDIAKAATALSCR